MKPYILSRYDFGAYTVLDRATGRRVGSVLAGYTAGWYAYSAGERELVFETRHVDGLGRIDVTLTHLRSTAADRVWQEANK